MRWVLPGGMGTGSCAGKSGREGRVARADTAADRRGGLMN